MRSDQSAVVQNSTGAPARIPKPVLIIPAPPSTRPLAGSGYTAAKRIGIYELQRSGFLYSTLWPLATSLIFACSAGSGKDDASGGDTNANPDITGDILFNNDGMQHDDSGNETVWDLSANTPPIIDKLPSATVAQGHSVIVDLAELISDAQDKDDSLTIELSASHVASKTLENSQILLVGPVDWEGPDQLIVTVTDSGGLQDTEQMLVKVTPVEAPDPLDVVEDISDQDVVVEPDAVETDNNEPDSVEPPCGEVTFEFDAEPSVTDVYITGSFNEWSINDPQWRMIDANGDTVFTLTKILAPGTHKYKFYAGNTWYDDPKNPNSEPDGYGGKNSIINIPSCQ